MLIHPKMMAQHMARDPFHHALRQPVIDHARQRQVQGGIAHHILDTGPEVQNGLGAGEGGKILDPAIGGIDDVIDLMRGHFGGKVGLDPGFGQGGP